MPIALMYHDVVAPGRDDESGFAGAAAARYKMTPGEFATHLDAIGRAAPPRSRCRSSWPSGRRPPAP